MAWVGPCINFWCMRMESFHTILKANAQSIHGAKNLLLSIAKKQVYRMCQLVHTYQTTPAIKYGSLDDSGCYDFLEIDGIMYRCGTMVVTDLSGSEKEFGKIETIKVINEKIIFKIKSFEEIVFDSHYHIYRIARNQQKDREIFHSDLPTVMPVTSLKITLADGDCHCIVPRHVM